MLTLQTAHFGLVEYAEGTEIEFPCGLPAFENERAFVLLRRPGYEPLLFLQSVSTPHLAFLGAVSANLQAPLVIHRERHLAIQVIQSNPAYSCHYPLGTATAPSQETPCL
jgi:flagellar assembly factor FliW